MKLAGASPIMTTYDYRAVVSRELLLDYSADCLVDLLVELAKDTISPLWEFAEFRRAFILDGRGNPIDVTALTDEQKRAEPERVIHAWISVRRKKERFS